MIRIYRQVADLVMARSLGPLVFAAAAFLLISNALITRLRLLAWGNEIMLFGSFWEAGNAANFGRNPYGIYPLIYQSPAAPPIPEINLNPPSILPVFQFVALFEPPSARLAWLMATAAIFVLGAWVVFRAGRPNNLQTIWLLLFPAIPQDLALGQLYSLLFALGVGAWLGLRSGREIAAAVCMGLLIAIKPNFGVWCMLALAAGHVRPVLVAAAIALVLTVLPAAFYGIEVYQQWFAAVALDRHSIFPSNIALAGLFARMGVPVLAYVPILALLAWSVVWCRRVRPSLYDLTPVAVLVGVLCAPIGWFHYLLIISAFIVDRPWSRAMIIAIVLTFLERFWGQMSDLDLPLRAAVSLLAMAPALIMLPEFTSRARKNAAIGSAPTI